MARPSQPKLSIPAIAKAALKLVDDHGDFTLPQLAKALKVSASSLYNHVKGRDEIIELMRGQAMQVISLPHLEPEKWQESVQLIATEYWASYSKHPRLIPLMTSYTVRDSTTLRVYDALAEAFAAAGFAPKQRLQAITIIDSFILGSALDSAAPAEVWLADEQASPEFKAALESGQNTEDRARQSFELGLEIILDGLARTVPTTRA